MVPPATASNWRVAFVLALVFAVSPAGIEGTTAAVRLCEPPVSSGLVKDASEKAAHAKALAIWKSKAVKHGEAFGSWRLAASKLLKCLPARDGTFECMARAEPCRIEQAPNSLELRRKRLDL